MIQGHIQQVHFLNSNSDFFFLSIFFWEENLSILNWFWATSNRFYFPQGHIQQVHFLNSNSDFFFFLSIFFWEENLSILNWYWATSNRFYFPLSKWLLISNDFFFFKSLGLTFSKKNSLGLSDYALIFFSMCWFTNEKLNLCGRFWK